MMRREFITLLGGAAAAWPLAARAQQPAVRTIGYLSGASSDALSAGLADFRRGLSETGYVEGRNIEIEYRFADGEYDRLPALADDLARRQVAVIITGGAGVPATIAAKAATAVIPIVFTIGADPVRLGFVANLNRPGGNLTGVASLSTELRGKALGVLHDLVPSAKTILFISNPRNPNAGGQIAQLQSATEAIGRNILDISASTGLEIDAAFEIASRQKADALVVAADGFFRSRRDRIVALAARYAIPTIYPFRDFVDAGGLASYSPSDAFRQTGVYTGLIVIG